MEVVKKNLLSIIFGVIALLAVAALFYPIGGMYDKLLNGNSNDPTAPPSLKDEAGKYDQTVKLLATKRQLPVLPELGSKVGNTSPPLVDDKGNPLFPNQPVIDAALAAVADVHKESLRLVDAAESCNKHELLDSEVLPDVRSKDANRFQTKYKQALVDIANQVLVATAPPTDKEIDDAGQDLKMKVYLPQIYTVQGVPQNEAQVTKDWQNACLLIPIQMRDDRANKFKMYLLPDALSVQSSMYEGKTPSDEEVWYAQLTLWVEQDVAGALAQANLASDNVKNSPVKQLVKLDIAQDQTIYVTQQDLKNSQPGGAKPDAAAGGPAYEISPTGRVCNSLYDVVKFTLVLNIDATRLPEVLADLERNKLITVTQVDASSVNSSTALDNGFVFGKAPVVQVTLQCEELFLRSWVDKFMPLSVRHLVHGDSDTPGGPGGAGNPGNPGGGPGPMGQPHRPSDM